MRRRTGVVSLETGNDRKDQKDEPARLRMAADEARHQLDLGLIHRRRRSSRPDRPCKQTAPHTLTCLMRCKAPFLSRGRRSTPVAPDAMATRVQDFFRAMPWSLRCFSAASLCVSSPTHTSINCAGLPGSSAERLKSSTSPTTIFNQAGCAPAKPVNRTGRRIGSGRMNDYWNFTSTFGSSALILACVSAG